MPLDTPDDIGIKSEQYPELTSQTTCSLLPDFLPSLMLLNETPFSDSGTPSAIAPPAEDPTTMKQFTRPRLLDSEAGVCAGMEPPKDLSKFKRGYDDFVHMITAKSRATQGGKRGRRIPCHFTSSPTRPRIRCPCSYSCLCPCPCLYSRLCRRLYLRLCLHLCPGPCSRSSGCLRP